MTPEQILLVRASFAQVKALGDQAAALFYERLFALDPSLRALLGIGGVLKQVPAPGTITVADMPNLLHRSDEAALLASGTWYSISTITGPASRSKGKASLSSGSCRGRRSGASLGHAGVGRLV